MKQIKRFVSWIRKNPLASMLGSILGLIAMISGVLGQAMFHEDSQVRTYWIVLFIIGTAIITIINFGAPLRQGPD